MKGLNRKAVILTVIILANVSFAGTYSGGFGTETDPYRIGTVADWQELMADSNDWDANFIMIADINLQGIPLIPVGNDLNSSNPLLFTGVFDGNGHVIRNAAIDMHGSWYIGLFGHITTGSQIRNLGVEDVNMSGGDRVGGLVGCSSGIISNCYTTGKVSPPISMSGTNFGGLVGKNYGTITGSHAACDVNGYLSRIGGLVGWNVGTIIDSYANGTVNGPESVGGLVGDNSDTIGATIFFIGSIARCYATASVNGQYYVGGLVGINGNNIDRIFTSITDCYATGPVTGGRKVGGLVGWNSFGPVTDCHATGAVTGTGSVGGLVGSNENENSVTNCYATGAVAGTVSSLNNDNVGGLIGGNGGLVTNCYATGTVTVAGTASHNAGGLMGHNGSRRVTNCYAEGSVSGHLYVGGLVGANGTTSPFQHTITDCYAKGAVRGAGYVGGLVGCNNFGDVANCYAAGMVSGDSNVGGLIGYNIFAATNCFWDMETSGQASSTGGTGMTTAEMKTLSTFTSAGWDFSYTDGNQAVWFMPIDEYPILTWQISPADLYTDGKNNFKDFAIFAQYWLREDCAIYNDYCEWADMNFDGHVDISDLADFISYWLEEGIY